ncbi:B-cell receptor-associated 31-like [Thalictrum thalictroides]|uniref:Endoplasmic reticulum transmembrane protein n=1 Tax=Thalictrum thalictroides TaxID=46969 RepID=A0A7J6V216_THATH|nr:B-cell receptor-associated 31-like [Thalictrum thalictroides]
MALILILSFKSPLRKVAIWGVDQVKRGRGPIIVKTVAGTIFVVLMSSLYSLYEIQDHTTESGSINPTDQVINERHLLEASLMGFTLFLALMIDRVHHYIRELRSLRKIIKAVKERESESMMKAKEAKVA